MQGYIKTYRKMMDSPIWQDPFYLKLWMYCLMKASHKEHEQIVGDSMITLQPGEFITGRMSLTDDLNKGMKPKQRQSETTWWRYLNNLEKWGMLNIKKTNKYSVVTVSKWDDYQGNEQEMNNKRTSNEQQMDIRWTSDGHQMNTNKNGNKGENGKNGKSSRKYIYDDKHYSLADRFYNKILENNPDHKMPNLESWANEMRLMMERDSRNEEQIKYLIDWVQQDDFEMSNVLSPSKLRSRFDQLVLKVKNEKGHSARRKVVNLDDFNLDD